MGAEGVDHPIVLGDVVIVVATGADPPDAVCRALPAGAAVVAADGGVDAARAMGLRVDLAIGDMDSVSPAGLAAAEAAGARVECHPVEKDATDLELALDAAVAGGGRDVLVLASGGGRLDHLLAAAALLAHPARAGVRLRAWFGAAQIAVVTPVNPGLIEGAPGDLVSLLPWHGPARGVRTDGLAFPLHDEDLPAGTSRGVSNVLVAAEAQVSIAGGTLLAVLPAGADEGGAP